MEVTSKIPSSSVTQKGLTTKRIFFFVTLIKETTDKQKKPSPAFNYTLFASEEGNMAVGTKISLAYCGILHHYLCTIPHTYVNMYLLFIYFFLFFYFFVSFNMLCS